MSNFYFSQTIAKECETFLIGGTETPDDGANLSTADPTNASKPLNIRTCVKYHQPIDFNNVAVSNFTGGGGGGGDVFLAGGTVLLPQVFTGYNRFDNHIMIGSTTNFSEYQAGKMLLHRNGSSEEIDFVDASQNKEVSIGRNKTNNAIEITTQGAIEPRLNLVNASQSPKYQINGVDLAESDLTNDRGYAQLMGGTDPVNPQVFGSTATTYNKFSQLSADFIYSIGNIVVQNEYRIGTLGTDRQLRCTDLDTVNMALLDATQNRFTGEVSANTLTAENVDNTSEPILSLRSTDYTNTITYAGSISQENENMRFQASVPVAGSATGARFIWRLPTGAGSPDSMQLRFNTTTNTVNLELYDPATTAMYKCLTQSPSDIQGIVGSAGLLPNTSMTFNVAQTFAGGVNLTSTPASGAVAFSSSTGDMTFSSGAQLLKDTFQSGGADLFDTVGGLVDRSATSLLPSVFNLVTGTPTGTEIQLASGITIHIASAVISQRNGTNGSTPVYRVSMRGRLTGFATSTGTNILLFTLPTGYRPTIEQNFICMGHTGDKLVRIDIATSGTVTISGAGSSVGSQFVNLGTIEFWAGI